jgi:hypothetical protein
MLEVQQLPPFHILSWIYLHSFQVLFIIVQALSKDVDISRQVGNPVANSSDQD